MEFAALPAASANGCQQLQQQHLQRIGLVYSFMQLQWQSEACPTLPAVPTCTVSFHAEYAVGSTGVHLKPFYYAHRLLKAVYELIAGYERQQRGRSAGDRQQLAAGAIRERSAR